MMKFSIERALVWAYREQMVHVALPAGVPVEASQGYSPGLSEGTFLADKVDSGVKMGFAAHADAYAIHAAVQRLPPISIARNPDEMEMLYARRLIKNDFDSMDRRGTGDASKPWPTVQLMPRAIVQEYAMVARRPDRADEVCVIFEKGKRVHMDRHGRVVQHYTKYGFHMLNVVGDDPLEVIAARRVYAVWHGALARIRDCLLHNASSLSFIFLTEDLPLPPLGY